MNCLRLQSFTLFEALLAWSLFILVMTSVAFAQTRALRSLRAAYLNESAVIQILNIKNRFIALQDDSLRDQTYKHWHQHNVALLNKIKDSYTCEFKSCCVNLSWSKQTLHSCF